MSDSNPFEPSTPDPQPDPTEAAAVAARLYWLNVLYAVLWSSAIATIAFNYLAFRTTLTTVGFWVLLLAAVGVRLYRTSVANRYNVARGGPFS